MKTITFKGEEYVFGADSLDEPGFIAKRKDFEQGRCSFAHYFPDERGVMRLHKQIGSRKDIQITGDSDVAPGGIRAMLNMLFDWSRT